MATEQMLQLGPRIRLLSQALHRDMNSRLAEIGLTEVQSFILRYLETCGTRPVCQKDIEQRFHLSHPTVSGILQRMETKGFIVTREDPKDRRKKRIFLTPKAAEARQQILGMITAMEQTMLTGMTEEETALLISLLDRATDNLKSDFDPEEEEKQND